MGKYATMVPSVRSAARALIVREGQLLTIEMQRQGGDIFYILPGGGQSHGETLRESLLRECEEEIGVHPIIGKVAYVREYIGKHHTFADRHRNFHQLEIVFHCTLDPTCQVLSANDPDRHQIGIRWLPLDGLDAFEFYPKVLTRYVVDGQLEVEELYLGDIN